ncbi:MAG TPA: PhzF family phenazine biosynthesis protein [Cyclobacteriaceae bacterium]|nr:PhzF family phenazine biosynthesis protein [Cyclobacteriaceae bacterium]
MRIQVKIINAFVFDGQGGNPAGVVLDADELSSDQKLKIAAKVGLSETAFVSRSSVADFKLDFFTPNRQIAHCGHATVAVFSYLSQTGRLNSNHSSKETIDGRREIIIRDGLAFMEQKAPQFYEPLELYDDVWFSLGLHANDGTEELPISVVNTGNSFLMVPVASKEKLATIRPDKKLIHKISEQLDLIGFYPFSLDTFQSGHDASTRMFGPRYAIDEEAGTGMAAGPLACYLHEKTINKKSGYVIEQGWLMTPPSPSEIIVDLNFQKGSIQGLMAGGRGKVMRELELDI